MAACTPCTHRLRPGLVLAAALAAPGVALGSALAEFQSLLDQSWEARLAESPTFASSLGDRRYNDRWPDESLEAIERRHRRTAEELEALAAIDVAALPAGAQLDYELFRRELEEALEAHRFRQFLIPLNQRGGVQTADELVEQLRFDTVEDYEDWLARLAALDRYVEQTITLMRLGITERRVHPKVIMERVPAQIAAQVVDDPADSPFFAPFNTFPDGFDTPTRERLADSARDTISSRIVPAYARLLDFFEREYLPACRDSIGAWDLPDGEEFYRYRVSRYTTTDLTPQQIHEIGLAEVARIRAQMQLIIDGLGFDGDFAAFLAFLRNDPQFYFEDAEDLLQAYRAAAKRIDPELVKLFGRLPRMPYGVRPIPDKIAPDTTTAYYSRPAGDGSRPGYYYVNLYKPEVRPKYEIEVLTVHEAVPGHHLQIALAQELGELPAFRRYLGFTGFVEGWALYSESLGEEMGLYQDPYSKFGQLTYEMWRAVRLVVDTGMHAKRWTRQQAIEYFAANAAKTEHDIVNEIDRYIGWPGQALAYKIGELKIKALRERSEARLGASFDIRGFHDTVLASGAVPLDVLERQVERWLDGQAAATAQTAAP